MKESLGEFVISSIGDFVVRWGRFGEQEHPKNSPHVAKEPFHKVESSVPKNPPVSQIIRDKPIAQAMVHIPRVTVGQTRVAPSSECATGIFPQSMSRPSTPPHSLRFAKTFGYIAETPPILRLPPGVNIPKTVSVKTGNPKYTPAAPKNIPPGNHRRGIRKK